MALFLCPVSSEKYCNWKYSKSYFLNLSVSSFRYILLLIQLKNIRCFKPEIKSPLLFGKK